MYIMRRLCGNVSRRNQRNSDATHTRMLLLYKRYKRVRRRGTVRGNVHWDVDELDEVANETHNSKANSDSLANLSEFYKTIEENREW